MFFRTIFQIAIGLGAFAALASATTYANFCDDPGCTVNCGISVSVDNPGCLNESGRQSVAFHDENVSNVALVFSPAPDCPCQNNCIGDILSGVFPGPYDIGSGCVDISNQPYAQSFRFIGQGCEADNCS